MYTVAIFSILQPAQIFPAMTQQFHMITGLSSRVKMADVPPGSATPKKKEIYKYTAPWSVYAMNWSLRPDKKFRLALGSFIEDYSNKVGRLPCTS